MMKVESWFRRLRNDVESKETTLWTEREVQD